MSHPDATPEAAEAVQKIPGSESPTNGELLGAPELRDQYQNAKADLERLEADAKRCSKTAGEMADKAKKLAEDIQKYRDEQRTPKATRRTQ